MAGGVGGAERLNYNLFADGAHTISYPTDGTESTAPRTQLNNPGAGVQFYDVPVYGVIPAGQFVSGGVYNDSVASTVHF